ncbi:MAG: hypothetical protein WCY37_06065 [Candidatus Dojkabacteria bacterium]
MPVDMNKAKKAVEGKLRGRRVPKKDPHYWYQIEVPEPITPIEIKCPFNHAHHDMSDNIIKSIARSMGITTRFLVDIFTCHKNYCDLITQLEKEDRRDL